MRKTLLTLFALAGAGCAALINTGEDEGRPCLNNQCLPGYLCVSNVCVSKFPKHDGGTAPRVDGGTVRPDAGGIPVTGWQATERVGHPDGDRSDNTAPRVAVAGNHDVFVAFSDTSDVFVRRRVASTGAWDPLYEASSGSGQGDSPRIAADSAGNAVVAWSNGGTLYARRFQEGSWLTWDQVYSYGGGPGSVSLLDVGMSSSGQAALLFTVTPYVGPPPSIWVAWWYGGSWSTSQLVGPSASLGGGALGVCVSGNTYLRVAYLDGSTVTEVPAMLSGGSLMPAGSTTLSTRGTTVAPVLKVVGLNCASLAVILHGSSLWAARAGASMSSWGSEQQVSSSDTVSAAAGAIDATGSAAVLYSCSSGCGVRMVAWPGSGQPYSPISASDQPGAAEPDVAADGTGRFLAVFSQTVSGTQGIWAGEFTPPATLTPSHAIGSTLGSSCSTPSAGYASGIGYAAWVRTYASTGYRKIEGALYDSGVK